MRMSREEVSREVRRYARGGRTRAKVRHGAFQLGNASVAGRVAGRVGGAAPSRRLAAGQKNLHPRAARVRSR